MTAPLSPTERTRIRRFPQRARVDRAELAAILDEALLCHVGVAVDGGPRVVPTTFGRDGDTLYLHGSVASQSLAAAGSAAVCVTVTLVDGLVYARTPKNFSVNYRSAVIYGSPTPVTDEQAKLHALAVIVERLAPGSWDYTRPPGAKDLAATTVPAFDLAEASVKVRAGGPTDTAADVSAGGIWAGVLPMVQSRGEPERAFDLSDDVPLPDHIGDRR